MKNEPFHYNEIQYNELIQHIENSWNRNLHKWEIDLAVYAYRIGRYAQMESDYINELNKGEN